MEQQTFNKMIDMCQLKLDVRELAGLVLDEINEDNLDYFANETKKIAKSTFEKYVFDVYDLYTSGALAIQDTYKLEIFTNPDKGYQQKMLEWENQYEISISKQVIELPENPENSRPQIHKKGFVIGTTAGTAVYTAIATGLLIMGHPWIALAIELLTLSCAFVQYKLYSYGEKEYAMRVEQYRMDIEKKKQEFIAGIISDLENWLTKGENYSKELLASFDLV